MDENETINIELEHRKTPALSKEHYHSLIAQFNSKSMENTDLKGQIQEKVFVTTTLQNELRKLKAKNVLDNATIITNATTITPGMFKLDLDPLAPIIREYLFCSMVPLAPTANKPSEKLVAGHTNEQRLKSSTSASRPQPTGYKKNDKISQKPSSNMKNKVKISEDQRNEAPELIIKCIKNIQVRLNVTPIYMCQFHETLHEDFTSQGSLSIVRPSHTPFELLGKWTKNHLIENVIGDPSCLVSTRKQLQPAAMWCYFDAFLTSVKLKTYKEAMLKPSWIDAMQEEIHEFERLKV
ncbi:hypothetical protein Tco_0638262 [Tanacetum coccineum]